jgi:uncharacterized cupredoxin-like copper-binding protein
MRTLSMLLTTAFLSTATVFAFAHGDEHERNFSFGSPGKEAEATRTVEVTATDMKFIPATLEVKQGETIRFVVKNMGQVQHEFSIGDKAAQRAHERMMKKTPDMKHTDDPTAVTLQPGETKTLVWKFDKTPPTPLEFACHELGHYDAGMKMDVALTK